jgi:prevent-host-death family protein
MASRTQVNILEAKTQLSRLVKEAAAGREIVIASNGRPRAKLVPIRPFVVSGDGGR